MSALPISCRFPAKFPVAGLRGWPAFLPSGVPRPLRRSALVLFPVFLLAYNAGAMLICRFPSPSLLPAVISLIVLTGSLYNIPL